MTSAGILLAHGIGGRTDLPLPVWMFGYGAAAALVVSFAALAIFWPTPRFEAPGPWPKRSPRLGATTRAPTTRSHPALVATRVVGLVLFLVVLGAAVFGDSASFANLAPVAVYVIFWVGLTIVSGLLTDVWRPALDPFPVLAGPLAPDSPRAYTFGHWPAAAGLAAFVWIELAYPSRAEPRLLAVLIVTYTAVVFAGTAVWGRRFLDEGETFAVWFGLLGAMAPLGPKEDGRFGLRVPLSGLARINVLPGTVAVVIVALGSTAFDGLTRTTFWTNLTADRTAWGQVPFLSLGLVWMVGVVALAYLSAMRAAGRLTGQPTRVLADAFVHSLVPIALGYAVAHYISLLLLEGQAALVLASDPFSRGWNLFGTASWSVNYQLVSTRTIAYVQVASIVFGHIAGVVLAHDRAIAIFPKDTATRSQYPLLAVMVAFTVGGLGLLLGG